MVSVTKEKSLSRGFWCLALVMLPLEEPEENKRDTENNENDVERVVVVIGGGAGAGKVFSSIAIAVLT